VPIEFLGSKARILQFVLAPMVGDGDIRSVADVFCGTGAVSHALGLTGRRVVASDHLRLCVTLAEASLLAPAPSFSGLRNDVRPSPRVSMYEALLDALQQEPAHPGFIHATYSPASGRRGPQERRYFTEDNAARIDTVRARIGAWEDRLTRGERAVLLRDLVVAASRVSNTAGTYGCFLRQWKARALEPLRLEPRPGPYAGGIGHEVHHGEAVEAARIDTVDAIYLDPPYTKRQYAAYYHVLETIVAGDEPAVEGVTGLRPWSHRDSDFCHRRRASQALRTLVAGVNARKIFLSYSDDGHLEHETILEILRSRGTVRWWEQPLRRYRSSRLEHASRAVNERLYALTLS
jgi:adenine-specific DNA-methyltransferase